MATTRYIRLKGVLTATSAISYSPPDHLDQKNVACFPTMRMADGNRPYISGATPRGILRRAADDNVRELLQNPLTPAMKALQSRIGGAKGSENVEFDFETKRRLRAADPVLSLFGAGQTSVGMIEGKVQVGMVIPRRDIRDRQPGARAAENKKDSFLNLLSPEERDNMAQFNVINAAKSKVKAEIKKLIDEERKAKKEKAETKTIEDQLEAKKAELTVLEKSAADIISSNTIGQPLPGFEYLPEGTEMDHEIRLQDVTDEELSLFILSLQRWAENPRMGSKQSLNNGYFRATYQMDERVRKAPGEIVWEPLATISIDPEFGAKMNWHTPLNLPVPTVDLDAWLATV